MAVSLSQDTHFFKKNRKGAVYEVLRLPWIYSPTPRVSYFCLQTPTIFNPLFFKLLEFKEKKSLLVLPTLNLTRATLNLRENSRPLTFEILGLPHVQFYNFQILEFRDRKLETRGVGLYLILTLELNQSNKQPHNNHY
jgi:hypothetical protein